MKTYFSSFLTICCTILLPFILGCNKEKTGDTTSDITSIENGLLPAIMIKRDSVIGFNLVERMKHYNVPGVSIAIVKNGKIKWAKGYGLADMETGRPVDTNTLFQAGSISKPIAGLGSMILVEEGKISLDKNVNSYLKDWKIPENNFTFEEKVTLRRLLTHTAGINFSSSLGYRQVDSLPTFTQILNGSGNTPKVLVDTVPGTIWKYSNGGYLIIQKLIEDVSNQSFDYFMLKNVLLPLGMQYSTFEQPLNVKAHFNVSAAYDQNGKIIEGKWYNYPEKAAAGLWTTPTDLAKYCIEIQELLKGKKNGLLSKETTEKMLTKHDNDWGLGPALAGDGDSLRFHHAGKTIGFTNNMIAYAHKGDAIIIMTNGDGGGKLMGEILRSASDHYKWNIAKPREIELASSVEFNFEPLLGKYLYVDEVPGIGRYYVDMIKEDGNIVIVDPNDRQRHKMQAIDSLNYIDLEDGCEIAINVTLDSIGFKWKAWNNIYQYYKTEN